MCECNANCIYCGSLVHKEDCENHGVKYVWGTQNTLGKLVRYHGYGYWEENNHGPGKCCDACQYCREGVPHVKEVCANNIGIPADLVLPENWRGWNA